MVASSCPVVGSQSFTVPSTAPEASVLPSGENATRHTHDPCPRRANRSCPLVVLHTFTVPSRPNEAEATTLPSGESETEFTLGCRVGQLKRWCLWHCCQR